MGNTEIWPGGRDPVRGMPQDGRPHYWLRATDLVTQVEDAQAKGDEDTLASLLAEVDARDKTPGRTTAERLASLDEDYVAPCGDGSCEVCSAPHGSLC